jgi:hypothetical protein
MEVDMLPITFSRFRVVILSGLVICVLTCAAVAADKSETAEKKPAVNEPWSNLPLPKIGVRQEDHAPFTGNGIANYVWVQMPQIPLKWGQVHNVFDMHCFENPYDLELIDSRVLKGGTLEVRYRRGSQPNLLIIAELTPGPGKVELVVRPELDPSIDSDKQIPQDLPQLNVCLSLKRAQGCFDSYPNPFPEIIGRSFIFNDKGRTFLDTIPRGNVPKRHAPTDDDPRNNPPWAKRYHSDSFTVPVIGVVSRDKKHLIAIASDTSKSLAQAWAPCIHNYPQWVPKDASPAQRRWRMNIYIMPNDPDTLLKRVAKDLPDAFKLQEKSAAPKNKP